MTLSVWQPEVGLGLEMERVWESMSNCTHSFLTHNTTPSALQSAPLFLLEDDRVSVGRVTVVKRSIRRDDEGFRRVRDHYAVKGIVQCVAAYDDWRCILENFRMMKRASLL